VVVQGSVLTTTDGGARWTSAALGAVIGGFALYHLTAWAFVSRCRDFSAARRCEYRLQTSDSPGRWRPGGSLPASIGNPPLVLAVLSAQRAVALVAAAARHPAMYRTADGGLRWSAAASPCGRLGFWPSSLSVQAGNLWLLCHGSAAAGRQPKAVLRSADGGKTWHVIAVDQRVDQPGPLPLFDAGALAAESGSRLWLETAALLYQSRDGGHTWSAVPSVPPSQDLAGINAVFSFTSPADGWLLIPGTSPGDGLYRTTNARTWVRS
jgi:photosystem II stability/assembly factor-like uncharacterized protein